jgi:ribonuclease R
VFEETDGSPFPIDIQKRERNDAHRLIEDLMLAANEAVASYFVDRRLPSIFRVHEDPDPEKLQIFAALCATLGIQARLKRKPEPKDVAMLLDKLSDHPVGKSLNPLLLRSLMQARYDASCKGHFGLAAERYLHFTSPIRRYPDLIVHRLLRRALRGQDLGYDKEELQAIAQASSDAERKSMIAERESMDLDRAYVALEHLGETFPATITGVQSFGVFAAISAPFIEGMIPISMLGDDYFVLDEFGSMLTGEHSGITFGLGQTIQVTVANVSIARRQVELRLPEVEEEPRFRDDKAPGNRVGGDGERAVRRKRTDEVLDRYRSKKGGGPAQAKAKGDRRKNGHAGKGKAKPSQERNQKVGGKTSKGTAKPKTGRAERPGKKRR